MKLTIEGTPEEIKNVLQAICGSEGHAGEIDVGQTDETKGSNGATL